MNRASNPFPTPLCPTKRIGRGKGASLLASATVFIIAADNAMMAPAPTAAGIMAGKRV
jgi:hypothetical protein